MVYQIYKKCARTGSLRVLDTMSICVYLIHPRCLIRTKRSLEMHAFIYSNKSKLVKLSM